MRMLPRRFSLPATVGLLILVNGCGGQGHLPKAWGGSSASPNPASSPIGWCAYLSNSIAGSACSPAPQLPVGSSPAPSPSPSLTPSSSPSVVPVTPASGVGILVPLYVYPSSSSAWAPVIAAKQANPNANIVAIINPNTGPGNTSDPVYAAAVAQVKAAGITILGYVITYYGSASAASVETQISNYKQWYQTNGIFFDNMAYTPGFESYYSALTAYTKSLGMTMTVGNAGTDTVSSYIGSVDTIQIWENQGIPPLSFLAGWHAAYSPSNFAFTAYGVSSFNIAAEQAASPYVRYEYVTDETEPNPYTGFPSYFSTEVGNI